MKPAPFRYLRPGSVDEAVALLAEHSSEAVVLAGGQSLVPLLNQRRVRPAVVVDLAAVSELRGTAVGRNTVELGALVVQRPPAEVLAALPLLGLALPNVGHVQTRNRGTIAGSVAHGDPLAELPLALLVGGGEVELASARGRRRVPIDDFLDRAFAPARANDELVVATHWVRPGAGTGHAFVELTAGSTVAAAAMVSVDGDRLTSARVGVTGPADRPVVIEVEAEVSLAAGEGGRGEPGSEVVALGRRLAALLVDGVTFVDDAASDPAHRRAVAVELATRAVVAASANAATDPTNGEPADRSASGDPATRTGLDVGPIPAVEAGGDVPVVLSVDGRARTTPVEARTSLADALRAVGVTGVKLGCEQGVCGSCTVLLDGTSQRSCLVLAVQAEGVEVTTAAGLTEPIEELRAAFVDHFAVQCGFCASGVLVTAAAELAERQRAGTLDGLDRGTIAGLLSGNVCRCTGYGSMVAAIDQAARRLAERPRA